MAVSAVPRRSSQLQLFARPECNLHWTDLSSDVQQKMLRLLAQLLRQHRGEFMPTDAPIGVFKGHS